MPRMQVYLPNELYHAVKEQGLRASELLQQAVREELGRQALLAETDTYLAELVAEVGEPNADEIRKAEEFVDRLVQGSIERAS